MAVGGRSLGGSKRTTQRSTAGVEERDASASTLDGRHAACAGVLGATGRGREVAAGGDEEKTEGVERRELQERAGREKRINTLLTKRCL